LSAKAGRSLKATEIVVSVKDGKVSAGQPTTIEFTANQTGVFEVETHQSNLLLLQLQVR
jgi:hypothetical protein